MLYLILDLDILFKDLDLALFFILDIKTEKIIKKCPEKCPETANYYTTIAEGYRENTECYYMRPIKA